jgi:hypothetical protein
MNRYVYVKIGPPHAATAEEKKKEFVFIAEEMASGFYWWVADAEEHLEAAIAAGRTFHGPFDSMHEDRAAADTVLGMQHSGDWEWAPKWLN